MGRTKQLLDNRHDAARDRILDAEYMEWVYNSERPQTEDQDSSITEQSI